MTSPSVEPRPRLRWRWWMAILPVLALQVGLVFSLSEHSLKPPREPVSGPEFVLAAGRLPAFWLAVNDPTLFARPHPHGFSGPAWISTRSFEAPEWSEPPRFLGLAAGNLGRAFVEYMSTNARSRFALVARPVARFGSPEMFQPPAPLTTASTLRVEGEFAGRPLLSTYQLPPWASPNPSILKATVVGVGVDALGSTITPHLVESSGSPDADQYALQLARTARFEPLQREGPGRKIGPADGLVWGKMVFHWLTLPPAATNTPPATNTAAPPS